MEHLIFKYIEIGGNIPKFFWNIELIMSIYINKLSDKTESLSIARCFCNLLFNPMFYVEENLDKIENFLNCLKETICNPYEFLNEELLIKICDLSNYIFPFEHKRKFLVKTYESLLTHFIGSYKKKKSDEEGNNVNPFFDIILTKMKLIGFNVSKYDNANKQNNNKNDDRKKSINDNEETPGGVVNEKENSNKIENSYGNNLLSIYHFIRIIYTSKFIKLLNKTNLNHLLNSFLDFFSQYFSTNKGNETQQNIAKLLIIINIDYYFKITPSQDNYKKLKETISKLNCSPILIEAIISTTIITTSLEEQIHFHKTNIDLKFNLKDLSRFKILYLFQLISYILCKDIHNLSKENNIIVLSDYIEIYDLLIKCFQTVINDQQNKDFYNDFFSDKYGFMIKIYELYFRLYLENIEIIKQESFSPNDSSSTIGYHTIKYNEFITKLTKDFINISNKLISNHLNPFIYDVIYLIFSKGKEDNIPIIFEILTKIMDNFINNISLINSNKLCYCGNLISFYSKLNQLLVPKSKISNYLYKHHLSLCCRFLSLFKETLLIYTLIGIPFGDSTTLLSEAIFNNYLEMYYTYQNYFNETAQTQILEALNSMLYINPLNPKENVNISTEDNFDRQAVTICLLINHSKKYDILKTVDDICNIIVNQYKKYSVLNDVNSHMFFLTKSILHSFMINTNDQYIPLLNKLQCFSKYLIKELIENTGIKKINTKHTLYNNFINIVLVKNKNKNKTQTIDDIYSQLMKSCTDYYILQEECQKDLNIFTILNLNKHIWKTPNTKSIKSHAGSRSTSLSQFSPPPINDITNDKSIFSFSEIKDDTIIIICNSHFNQDYCSSSISNVFKNYFLDIHELETQANKEETNVQEGWFSFFFKKKPTSSTNDNTSQQLESELFENHNLIFEQILLENTSTSKKEKSYNTKFKTNKQENSFTQLNSKWSLINPKKQLLLTYFALEFKDVYFHSENFIKMKTAYFAYTNLPHLHRQTKSINYPSKIKNFSNSIEPPLFIKFNKHFFTNHYLKKSHSYIIKLPIEEQLITFHKRIPHNKAPLTYQCELINLDVSIYGNIHLYKTYLIFQSSNNDPRINNDPQIKLKYIFSSLPGDRIHKDKTIIIFHNEIKEILIRRFLYIWQAVELFLKDGRSYFFNFFIDTKLTDFLSYIRNLNKNINIISNKQELITKIEDYQKQWLNNQISTYEYMLHINKYASRSYKDVNQYPVFPWVLINYNHIFDLDFGIVVKDKGNQLIEKYEIELNKNELKNINKHNTEHIQSYRDFQYPICLQNSDKRENVIIKYNDDKKEGLFPFHLGNFYSTSAYIFFYLMRMNPYTNSLIKLQGNEQEEPDRMFDSLYDTQETFLNSLDSRELIPEFFCKIEHLINLNCSYFGVKSIGGLVDDVHFENNSLSKYVNFILIQRKFLNSEIVSSNITSWINYVFGVNQLSSNKMSCTVFNKFTYSQRMCFKERLNKSLHKSEKMNNGVIDYKSIYDKFLNKILIVLNFGQTPFQVFTKLHPKKTIEMYNEPNVNDNNKDINDEDIITNEDHLRLLGKGSKYKYKRITITNQSTIVCGSYYYIQSKTSSDNVYILTANGSVVLCKNILSNQHTQKNEMGDTFIIPGLYINTLNQVLHSIKCNEIVVYPEYSFCMLNEYKMIITCGYLINSIQVTTLFNEKAIHETKHFIMEDFVRAICKVNENMLLMGLNNGKLIECKLQLNKMSIKYTKTRFIYAHESSISIIEYVPYLNIIITAGDDNYIYIRKYNDFELLTVIHIDSSFKILSIKLSQMNCIYVLVCDTTINSANNMKVIGYTLTGIEFGQSEYGLYTNMDVLANSNVILGCFDDTCKCNNDNTHITSSHLHILHGSHLTMLGNLKLNTENNKLLYIKYNVNNKLLYCFYNNYFQGIEILNDTMLENIMFN